MSMPNVYLRRVLAAQGLPETLAPYDLQARAQNSSESGHAYLPLTQVFLDSHGGVFLYRTIVRESNLRPPDNMISQAQVLARYAHGKIHLDIKESLVVNLAVEKNNPMDTIRVDSVQIVPRFERVVQVTSKKK